MKRTVTISKTFTIEQFEEQQLETIELPSNARKIVNIGIAANTRYSTALKTYKLYYGALDTGETDVSNLSSRGLEIAEGKVSLTLTGNNKVYIAIPVELGFPVVVIDDEQKTISVSTINVTDADTSEVRSYYLAETIESASDDIGTGSKTIFFRTE